MLTIFTCSNSEFVAFDPTDERQRCVLFHLPDKQKALNILTRRNVFQDGDIIERYIQSSGLAAVVLIVFGL